MGGLHAIIETTESKSRDIQILLGDFNWSSKEYYNYSENYIESKIIVGVTNKIQKQIRGFQKR